MSTWDGLEQGAGSKAWDAAAAKLQSGAVTGELMETPSGRMLPARAAVEERINDFVDGLPPAAAINRNGLREELIWTLERLYGKAEPGRLPPSGPALEMIVLADGARPIFFFQDGRLSPGAGNGPFFDAIRDNAAPLEKAGRSIGRIESDLKWKPAWADKWYGGTAFMVTPELAMTNRHVMQSMVNETASAAGPFSLDGPYWINFEAELGSARRRRFKVRGVAWAGSAVVGSSLDLHRFDAALLRIGAAETSGDQLPPPLPVCLQDAARG